MQPKACNSESCSYIIYMTDMQKNKIKQNRKMKTKDN